MSRNALFGSLTVAGAIVGVAVSALSSPPPRPPQSAAPQLVRPASFGEPALAFASVQPPRRPGDAATCSAWEVSEIAMETILSEMIRRGWRPPTQGEVVDASQPLQGPLIVSLDPDALVPYTRPSTQPPFSSEPSASAEPFPMDDIEPEVPALPIPPGEPEPAIAIGEPESASN